ncbi:hypothetical protein FCR2A7T_07420 [Flavobacterium cauense R2A-7]|nr:hypothetical protein FCR2A7T_07420 [Flavobacterium cauense R2A-7]KGO79614.1 hypothetical protein Q762_14030 [Flavobacterium cauense R2A-7]
MWLIYDSNLAQLFFRKKIFNSLFFKGLHFFYKAIKKADQLQKHHKKTSRRRFKKNKNKQIIL